MTTGTTNGTYPTHIYHTGNRLASEDLARFLEARLEEMEKQPSRETKEVHGLFDLDAKDSHFKLCVLIEPGTAAKMDIVLQLGIVQQDSGVVTKAGDYNCLITATWQDYFLQGATIVLDCCFSPTDDWFPIVLGMFSPILSAGVNSTLAGLPL